MTKYLDEYNPNTQNVNNRVQADADKLKFNNIQSCVAVVLQPVGGGPMTGVHLSTITTYSSHELKQAMKELKQKAGSGTFDAFVVSMWSHHATTPLKAALKKLARAVYSVDIPPSGNSADVDVKFEMKSGRIGVYVRQHVTLLKSSGGGAIVKPGFALATPMPGKPMYMTDKDDEAKQWMAVDFRLLA